jgi:hypothetical protein
MSTHGVAAFDAKSGAVEATFTTPATSVSIDALAVPFVEGLGTPTAVPWIEAYDASNTLVDKRYSLPFPNPNWLAWQTLTVTGPAIVRVRFSSQRISPWIYGEFDNWRVTHSFNFNPCKFRGC